MNDWRSKLGITFDEILSSHEINADKLASNDWFTFVNDRREKLRALIESVCGGNFQPFTDNDEMEIETEEE